MASQTEQAEALRALVLVVAAGVLMVFILLLLIDTAVMRIRVTELRDITRAMATEQAGRR